MRKTVVGILSSLLLTCMAVVAHATNYPPGPGGANPDTLIYVRFVQDPAATPHPVAPDTVWGIGGIVTGFDTFPSGFAIYVQNRTATNAPWTGIDVFTGGTNYQPANAGTGWPGLQLGDSVMVYGRMEEFQGETEMVGFTGAFPTAAAAIRVRRISTGNPLPGFHVGTVNELRELPTNPNGEQWEGCLVRVNGPLRVARVGTSGQLGTFSSFLAVDNVACPDGSVGPCDSLFVDGSTMANPAIGQPPVGTILSFIQGIYNQRTRGYRIQVRNAADGIPGPPTVTNIFPIHDDTVRVVFDRDVTQASAEDESNYGLASFGSIDGAIRVEPNAVHVAITNGLADGDGETMTVQNITSATGQTMAAQQSLPFFNGVMTIANIQAPNPTALAGAPCDDRSRYAGTGATLGGRLTFRGTVVKAFGDLYYMQDASAATRNGISMFAPLSGLVVGRQYLIAGAVQEFFQETEAASNVYLRDEGPAPVPSPVLQPMSVLDDSTCDVTQSILTGEDFEGMLVRVEQAMIVVERDAGVGFLAAGPVPTLDDTMLVSNGNNSWTYDADSLDVLNINGILRWRFGFFDLYPRDDSDFDYKFTGVQEGTSELQFAIVNPARQVRVTFGLPHAEDVELGVFDVAGRKLATLASGRYAAGTHNKTWNGLDASGKQMRSGVYFYRLRVGKEERVLRGVKLD